MLQDLTSRQFSIGEILSDAWKLYKENFRLILIVTLIVYIPVNILLYFIPLGEGFSGLRFYWRAIQILEGLIGVIATMAISYAIKEKIEGKGVTWEEALKKALSKWTHAVGTQFILGIFLLGLTLLLVVPGIMYSVFWLFSLYAVLFHDKYGKAAFDYSKSIVKGRWWTVLGYSICFALLSVLIGVLGAIPQTLLPSHSIYAVATDTLIGIALAYFTVVFVIFFLNFEATRRLDVPATPNAQISSSAGQPVENKPLQF